MACTSPQLVAETFYEAFKGTLPQAHLEAVVSYIKENKKSYPATGEAKSDDEEKSDEENSDDERKSDDMELFHVEPTDYSYVFDGTAVNKNKTFTKGNGDFSGELVTGDTTKLFEETKYFHFVARDSFLQITFQDADSGDNIKTLGYFQTYAGVGKLRGHGSGTGKFSKTK